MSRRKFLHNGLGLLLAVPVVWAQSFLKLPLQSAEVQAICSLSPSSTSAVRLGKRYLLQHPEYCSSQLLTELIFSGWSESKRQLALSDSGILKEMLTRKIQLDFSFHNVSSLDGWVLSKTELQQWALMSLVAL